MKTAYTAVHNVKIFRPTFLRFVNFQLMTYDALAAAAAAAAVVTVVLYW